MKSSALTVVSERTCDAFAVFQQSDDCVFHEYVEPEMDSVVLQGTDHLETCTVTDMRQSRISMTAEITLENAPIGCAIEKGTPCFQFADARRSFLGVEFCHSAITEILAAAHRVGKVNAPVISIIDISHRRGYATFGHNCVRFTKEGFRNESDLYLSCRSLDCSTQASAPRTNNENVVFVGDVLGH